MSGQRVWLDVPFGEKDEAKARGARWDPEVRRWYDPWPDTPGLQRWAALPELPEVLPGEDRSLGSGLFVDLVPTSCWFTNVRSCVSQRDWERLRRVIIGRAGQRCEVCGAGEDRSVGRWLEAHERWAYDEAAGVQSLRRLICLCTDCHRTTHFGLAEVRGYRHEALRHLQGVTGMSAAQAEAHVGEAFAVWRERSQRSWSLDLGILTGAGVEVVEPPGGRERAATAGHTTRAVRDGEGQPVVGAAGGVGGQPSGSSSSGRQVDEDVESDPGARGGGWPTRLLHRVRQSELSWVSRRVLI